MTAKLILTGSLILVFLMSPSIFFGCDDDEDQEPSSDSGGSVDDDDDDYDSWEDSDCLYAEDIFWLYDFCELRFADKEGIEIPLIDLLDGCNVCIGECGYDNLEQGDCETALTCINEKCM